MMLLQTRKDLWYFLTAFKGFQYLILFVLLMLLFRTILLVLERMTSIGLSVVGTRVMRDMQMRLCRYSIPAKLERS